MPGYRQKDVGLFVQCPETDRQRVTCSMPGDRQTDRRTNKRLPVQCPETDGQTDRRGVTCSMPGDRQTDRQRQTDGRGVTCSMPGDRQTDRQTDEGLPVQCLETDGQTETDRQTGGYLLNARFFRVEERPGLHVLGHQVTAHLGDLVPVVEGRQGQVLVRRLLHTCGGKGGT